MQKFSTLSQNQSDALASQDCPNCQAHGTMVQVTGRTGATVKCSACGEKVNRPRGAPVANGAVQQQLAQKQNVSLKQLIEQMQGAQVAVNTQEGQQEGQESPEAKEAREAEAKARDEAKAKAKAQQERKKKLDQQIAKRIAETVPSPHPLLHEALRRVMCGIRNLLFVGPAGSGKSTLAEHLALALKVAYSITPWSAGITEGWLLGRFGADGQHMGTPFTQALVVPSVHNWDDFDAADPNVPLCANSAVANGVLTVSSQGQLLTFTRDPKSILVATANTWGYGATMQYIGRNQLDAATLSRFAGGKMFVDYDRDLEARLLSAPEHASPDTQDYATMFWKVRDAVLQGSMWHVWGTRELLAGAKLVTGSYTPREALAALSVDWPVDDKKAVGL